MMNRAILTKLMIFITCIIKIFILQFHRLKKSMKNLFGWLIFLLICLSCKALTEEGKLIFVQEIFRHGARNPFQSMGIGDDYVIKQDRRGELTKEGKSMHYLLGKKMKETYWDKLFGDTPFNPNKFYIRSTEVNRTIQSAMCHLAGLLQHVNPLTISADEAKFSSPPYPGVTAQPGLLFGPSLKMFQPLSIQTMQNVMSLCNPAEPLIRFMSYNCPLQNKWQHENMHLPDYQTYLHDPQFIKMMEILSKQLKKDVNITNFSKYFDSLESMKFRGKKVPSSFQDDSKISRTIRLYYALIGSVVFFGNQTQRKAVANDIINETISNMKKAVQHPDEANKWVLYSAHDLTISFFFNILKMSSPKCIYQHFKSGNISSDHCIFQNPTYASVLVFQLYSHQQSSPTFKLRYNGKYLRIPACNNKKSCKLSNFEAWFKKWKVQDVIKLCMSSCQMNERMSAIQKQIKLELEHPGELEYAVIEEEEQSIELSDDINEM